MTRTEIVAVAIRLLAIWFFVQGIALLSFSATVSGPGGAWLVGTLIHFALLAIVCALTWRLSVPLAQRILPDVDPDGPVTALSRREIERIALRVLGAFLVVLGLSGVGSSVFLASRLGTSAGVGNWISQLGGSDVGPRLVQSLIQAVFGAGLFLGAAGLRRVWEGIRSGDRDETSGDEGGAAEDPNAR